MENISPEQSVEFRFNLQSDACLGYLMGWKRLLANLYRNGQYRDEILNVWKEYMTLPSNKSLSNLTRCEGGLGFDNNPDDKQIHFQDYRRMAHIPKRIIIHICASKDGHNRWSLNELLDLKTSFVKVINDKVEGEYGDGIIAII